MARRLRYCKVCLKMYPELTFAHWNIGTPFQELLLCMGHSINEPDYCAIAPTLAGRITFLCCGS